MLIIDEFSSAFHNQLEELLISFFMETSTNAQIFIVSHSTNLLSNNIFRPDQEYAVEFHGNEGVAHRLVLTQNTDYPVVCFWNLFNIYFVLS